MKLSLLKCKGKIFFIGLLLLISIVPVTIYAGNGDINLTGGDPDIADILLMRKWILGIQSPITCEQAYYADANGNGYLSTIDLAITQRYILDISDTRFDPTGVYGDINGDGIAHGENIFDLEGDVGVLISLIGKSIDDISLEQFRRSDLNRDGAITNADITEYLRIIYPYSGSYDPLDIHDPEACLIH